MSSLKEFYSTVIEEEIEKQEITSSELKSATKYIVQNKNITGNGVANIVSIWPEYRCAYIYRYASLHTRLVSKYFLKLINKKDVKKVLYSKKDVKICCLEGGPGLDVVGLLKALSIIKYFYHQITQVSVLDINKEWNVSFNCIMEHLLQGELDDIPTSVFNEKKVKNQLLEVNLLEPLTEETIKIISTADIITLVKLIPGTKTRTEKMFKVLQKIGHLFKFGAIFLCIADCSSDIVDQINSISSRIGLQLVMGPLGPERFFFGSSTEKKNVYGCIPLQSAKVSVGGWNKTESSSLKNYRASLNQLDSPVLLEDTTGYLPSLSREIDSSEIYQSESSESNINSVSLYTDDDIDVPTISDDYNDSQINADLAESNYEEIDEEIFDTEDFIGATKAKNSAINDKFDFDFLEETGEEFIETEDFLEANKAKTCAINDNRDFDLLYEWYEKNPNSSTIQFKDSIFQFEDLKSVDPLDSRIEKQATAAKYHSCLSNVATQTEDKDSITSVEDDWTNEHRNTTIDDLLELTKALTDLLIVTNKFNAMEKK